MRYKQLVRRVKDMVVGFGIKIDIERYDWKKFLLQNVSFYKVQIQQINLGGTIVAMKKAGEETSGMKIEPRFAGREEVKWEKRDVVIRDGSGVVFEQKGVEAPVHWSDRAVEQPARLYFRTIKGKREASIKGMIERVVDAIVEGALHPNVGTSLIAKADAKTFADELFALSVSQRFAWNTPVWVNAGAELPAGEKPQCSACFLISVEDTMDSLMELQRAETMLFRRGSGTGTNLSTLRPRGASLSRGGNASGPVSFMSGFDAWASATKSGGSSRRAAKMCVLNADHPDIFEFIESKVLAGRMIRDLVAAGWDGDFNALATSWARYQNANHSVRVTDAFMHAVEMDAPWLLQFEGQYRREVKARDVWKKICEAAWECGDPGLQFHDTTNAWHTAPAAGPINTSNPCSEVVYIDNVACNLASLNLVQFYDSEVAGGFMIDDFSKAIRTIILSMEAIVGLSGYPTEKVAENSRDYRILGIGYTNLGALLMRAGIPYDSEEGRNLAAAVTSLLTAIGYRTSAEIARDCGGPFPGYAKNRDAMLGVIRKHMEASQKLEMGDSAWYEVKVAADEAWQEALAIGEVYGYRNAQISVIAPTGTISFMLDCDTTGLEPETGLVRRKRLAGGGNLKLVNQSVGPALRQLGYTEMRIQQQLDLLEKEERLDLSPSEMKVFQCAFGDNPIRDEAHVRMVAAIQPFLSGSASKTVNVLSTATPEDIGRLYMLAWKLGLKAISVYRDGSKGSQPLTVKTTKPAALVPSPALPTSLSVPVTETKPSAGNGSGGRPWGKRKRMPDERDSKTRKFTLEGHDFFMTVGLWPNGKPGETFITASAKEGSMFHGALDLLGQMTSLALQYGAPLRKIVEKFRHTRFPPSGFTGSEEFPTATSFADAFAQWLSRVFLEEEAKKKAEKVEVEVGLSGLLCPRGCGPMDQQGTCWRCSTCGESTGGCGG